MKKFVLEARKIEYAKHTDGAKMYAFENLSLQERAGK